MIVTGLRELSKKLLDLDTDIYVNKSSLTPDNMYIRTDSPYVPIPYEYTYVRIPKNLDTIQFKLEGLLWESSPAAYLKWVLSE